MGIFSSKVPAMASTLENLFCPARGTVLLETAACRLAGMARGVPLGGAGGSCANTCAASKSGGGGGTMGGTSFLCGASSATGTSSRCCCGGTTAASSETVGTTQGGKGGRREVGVRSTSSSTSLLGVPFKEAVARGPVSFDGVAIPPLLDMALNACRRELWQRSACVSDPVASRGVTRLVGVVSRDFGVLLLLFGVVPLPLPFPLPPVIALRGAGVAKKKAASGWGGGLGMELGTVGC